jgi:hypothetical protein
MAHAWERKMLSARLGLNALCDAGFQTQRASLRELEKMGMVCFHPRTIL